MKDNKNELNADVESQHAKSNISFFCFSFCFFKSAQTAAVQPLVWWVEKTFLCGFSLSYTLKDIMAWGLIYKTTDLFLLSQNISISSSQEYPDW